MEKLQLISEYKSIDKYRLSFNELAGITFGIDFEKFYQLGFWNDRYVCYSYINGDQVVSNISINKLDLIWGGKTRKALQIGTVMTHPDYRKKGLATSLMNTVLQEFENKIDFLYLFPDDGAVDFYRKFGFKESQDKLFTLEIKISKTDFKDIRKLDILNVKDLDIIRELALQRIPVSNIMGVKNGEHILLWYCLYILNKNIFYLKEEDIIILFKQDKGTLHIFDIISKKEVLIQNILKKIAEEDVEKVIFYFTPTFKDVDWNYITSEPNETVLIKPEQEFIKRDFAHPITAHA